MPIKRKRIITESSDETSNTTIKRERNTLENGNLFVENLTKTARSGYVYTTNLKNHPKIITFHDLKINEKYNCKKLIYQVSNFFFNFLIS